MLLLFVKPFYNVRRFFENACKRINTIYIANNVHMSWRKGTLSQMPNNSVPDFVLMPPAGGKEVMVGEGKVRVFGFGRTVV